MPDPDTPIACTLSPRDYAARAHALRTLAARALRSRGPIPGGERLRFAAGTATERELRAVIAAEQECCAFLQMHLHRAGDALVLDIRAPDAARPVIAELFA